MSAANALRLTGYRSFSRLYFVELDKTRTSGALALPNGPQKKIARLAHFPVDAYASLAHIVFIKSGQPNTKGTGEVVTDPLSNSPAD